MKDTATSIQTFGYNRFHQPHTDLFSANLGIAYPLGFLDCPVGSVIENNIDIFSRSSALNDPSFLDCEISVGHYFVAYEAIDPFYKFRIQQFKGKASDVTLPYSVYSGNGTDTTLFKTGELADFLGFGTENDGTTPSPLTLTYDMPVYPFWAYHMILDHFFQNSRIEDVEYWRKLWYDIFPTPTTTEANATLKELDDDYDFLKLRYINFEPDRFTTSRPQATGNAVQIPGIASNGTITGSVATIPNLLDAMLIQKVADMIEHGGYSYNDFKRILFGQDPIDDSAEYPVFLAGDSSPLQVSTVVNQTASSDATASTALGAQGGTVSAYLQRKNGFRYTCTRPGIYMPLVWIRPATYYRSGIAPEFARLKTVASGLIPQLADLQDEPIFNKEVSANYSSFTTTASNRIFGYQDRYQDYRTRTNRVIGTMRTTRKSWYISRPISSLAAGISSSFLKMNSLTYSPWVVTDEGEPHFFIRADHDLTRTLLLPQTSKPYAW